MSLKSVVAILSLAFAFQAKAEVSQELKNRLSQELNYVAAIYDAQYAPKDWKEKHLGWNLQNELAKAQTLVQNAQSVHDYRNAVASFIRSTSDYHVGYSFVSTEAATLPLQLKTVEGKTLIVFIDKTKLTPASFPFAEGDELLAIDDVAVPELKKSLIENMGNNVVTTDNALADLYLTRRRGSRNFVVPNGPVTLTLKRANSDQVVHHQLVWEYTPETIQGRTKTPISDTTQAKSVVLKSPMMTSPLAAELSHLGNEYGVGERNSFLPDFGPRLWETASDNEFEAYIYLNADSKLIGVVRIPNYTPANAEKAIKDFAGIVKKMETLTEGLIIDQLNNPGGSVFYLYTLASMLTKDSLSTPRHRMMVGPSDVVEATTLLKTLENIKNDDEAQKALGSSLGGYPASYQIVVNLRQFSRFMIDQWNAGKRTTDPYYVWGVDKINPSTETKYTKPIVLLTNELDFSGGDFFPAILQDNKRVTVIGTRTAGAGGYILQTSFANSFGLESITYTGSIAERVDLNPIENLGIKPDVSLPFTVDDVRNSYKSYIKEVQAQLKKAMN